MSSDKEHRRGGLNLGDAFGLGLLQSAANLVAQLGRSKLSAIFLGPSGVGMVAELNQICQTAFTPTSLAVGAALVQGVARAQAEGDRERIQRLHRSALTVVAILSVFAVIGSMVGAWVLLPDSWGEHRVPLAGVAAVGLAAAAIGGVYRQTMVATALLRQVTIVGIIGAVVSLVAVAIGIVLYGVAGLIGGAALATIVLLPVLYRALSSSLADLDLSPRLVLDRGFVRDAIALGAAAFLAGLLQQGVLLFIRTILNAEGGSELNGFFQAAWAIGFFYVRIILNSLGQFIFPTYAAAESVEDLSERVDEAVAFALRMSIPFTFAAIALVDLIVYALYDARFDPSLPVLSLFLVANLSRVVNWSIGGTLMYRKKPVGHLVMALYGHGTFALLSWLLLPVMGLRGIGLAFLLARLLGTVVVSLITRLFIGMPLSPKRLFGSWGTTLLAVAASVLVEQVWWGRWPVLLLAVVLAWRSGLIHAGWGRVRRLYARIRR